MKNLSRGILSYLDAFTFITKHRLIRYFIIPVLLGGLLVSLLFFGIIWFFSDDVGALIGRGLQWIPLENVRDYLLERANYMGGVVLFTLTFLMFKTLLIGVMSPFMSPLSEKVEHILMGDGYTPTPLTAQQMFVDLIRGLRIALRNLIRELLFSLLIVMLGLIPLLTVFVPFLLFGVQAYYAGFGNIDYTLERKMNVTQSKRFVRAHRGLALGNGSIFLLLLMIPFLGIVIAPPLATVASTLEVAPKFYDEDY